MKEKSIIFIHGLFQNPHCWVKWNNYFTENGYHCYSPSYPAHGGIPEKVRMQPDADLVNITLTDAINTMKDYVQKFKEKPILIGHSMGGLIAQNLLLNNFASAAVCIHSAPPKGIFSFNWNFIKNNFVVINPFKGKQIFYPGFRWFNNTFCNTMTEEEAIDFYNDTAVPESREIPRSSIGKQGYLDMKQTHNPILFIAGKDDVLVPASLNTKNYNAYTDKNSKKEIKYYNGRGHGTCYQEGWQAVANDILDWLNNEVK